MQALSELLVLSAQCHSIMLVTEAIKIQYNKHTVLQCSSSRAEEQSGWPSQTWVFGIHRVTFPSRPHENWSSEQTRAPAR